MLNEYSGLHRPHVLKEGFHSLIPSATTGLAGLHRIHADYIFSIIDRGHAVFELSRHLQEATIVSAIVIMFNYQRSSPETYGTLHTWSRHKLSFQDGLPDNNFLRGNTTYADMGSLLMKKSARMVC